MRAIARVLLGCAATLAAAAVQAEVTRTLSVEVPDGARTGLGVENLVGRMRVAAAPGESVVISATVHAESQALADQIRLDRQSADGGMPMISVRYPEDVHTLKYPVGNDNDGWILDLFSAGESRRYRGRAFRVSRSHGRLLYVDLEVRVPAHLSAGQFRNLVGRLEADGVEGKLSFEVESADLTLERLGGAVTVHGTSGDIHATEISGDWSSAFTSGDCKLRGFHGGALALETTSGDIEAREISANRIHVRTTSGDTAVEEADVEEVEARSTSGNLEFEQRTNRLARARIDATSGDVRLRLPSDAAFEADAGFDSGDFTMGFRDAAVTSRGQTRMACQRGAGGSRIRVDTTSGNITIEPR
jgi:putative adhesin